MLFARQLWQQVSTIFMSLSKARRVGLVVVAAVCVLGLIGVAFYATQQDFRLLYSGLTPEDAGAVTSKLQSRGVPFRLGAGGSSILVPSDQVSQLRLDLAVEGLPAKSKGFELFDEISIGMTPFQQHVNFDRALQTELARTITQVEPIVSARVHLVRPDPTPFVREQKPATASVVLKLRPGASLSRKTAAGITALVARSVEGLAPEQVTLLDTNGRLLSETKEGELFGPVSTQFDYRRELEAYLSSRAEEMLGRLLGPGRAIVRVTADMNFRHQKTKRESYDPEGRVLVKETISNRKAINNSSPAKGTAGAGSNLPTQGRTAPAPSAAATPGNTENDESTDSEWRATKVEQELEESRGLIERLTIAALVDLSQPEGSTGRTLTSTEVEEIVKQATGFKKDRDEIKVSDVKLPSLGTSDGAGADALDGDKWGWYMTLARNVSLGAIVLVGVGLGVLYYRRRRLAGASQEVAIPAALPLDAAARLANLAEDNPEAIARMLAAWIDESAPATTQSGGMAQAA